jgi:hypothetical protein
MADQQWTPGPSYKPVSQAAEAWIRASEKKQRAQQMHYKAESLLQTAEALERLAWKAWQQARREFHRKLGNPLPSDLEL